MDPVGYDPDPTIEKKKPYPDPTLKNMIEISKKKYEKNFDFRGNMEVEV